jgi:hypothetical protein
VAKNGEDIISLGGFSQAPNRIDGSLSKRNKVRERRKKERNRGENERWRKKQNKEKVRKRDGEHEKKKRKLMKGGNKRLQAAETHRLIRPSSNDLAAGEKRSSGTNSNLEYRILITQTNKNSLISTSNIGFHKVLVHAVPLICFTKIVASKGGLATDHFINHDTE